MKYVSIIFLLIVLFLGNFSCKKENQIVPKKQPVPNVKSNPHSNAIDNSTDLFMKQFANENSKWTTYYD